MSESTVKTKKIASKKAKKVPKEEEVDSTFVLKDVNSTNLEKMYAISDITSNQYRKKPAAKEEGSFTTSLERLGIASARREPTDTILWGDSYKISIFVNDNSRRWELTAETSSTIRCTWCRLPPVAGSLILAVPYKFVSSYVHEHVYAPECVNVVGSILVDPSKMITSEKTTRKTDPKSALKMNYFRRDLTQSDQERYDEDDNRVVTRDYFEAVKPVCSFSCMKSKGKELAKHDPKFRNVNMHITHLYQRIFNALPPFIPEAASPDIMQQYGGEYTEEEYRRDLMATTVSNTGQYFTKIKGLLNGNTELFVSTRNDR